MASLLNKNNNQNTKLNQNNNLNQSIYNFKETPCMASLQDNRKVTLINYGHGNHPDYYSRLNQNNLINWQKDKFNIKK